MADLGSSVLSDAATGAALGSVIPGVGTLIGGAGGAAIGLISGIFQKKKANKILSQNPYPNYNIPPEILANQQLAQQRANEGMPSQQYEAAKRNIQQQQNAAINAAMDRRSGVQTIGAIQQGVNNANLNLDAESAQQRLANQEQLMNVNSEVAKYRNQAFDWNQKNRYLQNYSYGMQLLGAGNQNLIGGFDRLFATAGGLASTLSGRSGGSMPTATPSPNNLNGVGMQSVGATGAGSNLTDIIMNPNTAPLITG